MEKVSIKGIDLFPFVSQNQVADYVDEHSGILIAINAEKILNASEQAKELINSNIGYCDGSGPLMILHRKGYKKAIKIAGCDLWLSLVERFYNNKTFYLVGATQPVIEATIAKLRRDYPGINILGYRNGYISTQQEKDTLINDIKEKKPNIVFVAMGSPKQELLMEELQKHHKAIYQGLGGSFDVYTGSVMRAPKWWVDNHLEWMYRLIKQPCRITRQFKLVKFAYWIASGKY